MKPKKVIDCSNQTTDIHFRCVLEYHCIADFPKPENLEKRAHWNTDKPKTCAYKIDKNIYNPKKK